MITKKVVRTYLIVVAIVVAGVTMITGNAHAQHVLGVTLRDYHGRGAIVVSTTSGSASQRMICPDCSQYHQITPGVNVITAVNGQSVSDTAEAVRAISSSPILAEITILNLQRGTERTYQTKLETTKNGQASKRSGRSKQRGSGGNIVPQIDLNQSLFGTDSNDSTGSDSTGLNNWDMHNFSNQLQKNRGWSKRSDFDPVTR
ncbi:MAG: hypothetical protein ACK5PB_18975 [Pirellula sp.]|jgi:hypothetical protein